MKKIILFFILFLFVSCQKTEKEKFELLVKDWSGREILFPKTSKFTLYGKIFVDSVIPISDYKIVTYVDSLGCAGCKLQLPKWKELIEYTDSIMGYKIPVLFFLHPANVREMRLALKQHNFDYPVCMDIKDSLNILNNFPASLDFQTFLLDRNNCVISIGNPVHNYEVRELYFNIISKGKHVASVSDLKTSIMIKQDIVELGNFDSAQPQDALFEIMNNGNSDLVIYEVKTSCGCTSVAYDKAPIPPGKSTELKVRYKADHPEHFNKTITVHCNVGTSPVKLSIKGNAQ